MGWMLLVDAVEKVQYSTPYTIGPVSSIPLVQSSKPYTIGPVQ